MTCSGAKYSKIDMLDSDAIAHKISLDSTRYYKSFYTHHDDRVKTRLLLHEIEIRIDE